ncbi:MAG TPA: hypothetical protein DD641_03820, partial [Deltaproteobacteria bacterium]|nr:hypothetical protein [Deltaproteobacteria bacterium]
MKRALFSGVFQIVIFFIMILLPSLAFAEVVGYFSKIEGRVDILRVGADTAVSVRIGDPVSMGDIVRTKSDGKAEIIFKDETSVRLAPDTRVRIDEYTFNPDNTRNKGVLNLFRGKIRAVVSKVVGRVIPAGIGASTFNVNTPTAIAGVRGTDFFVFYVAGITGVAFKEGQGFVYTLNLPGAVVTIRGGQVTFVANQDTPPQPPRPASDFELIKHSNDTTVGEGGGSQEGDELLLAGGGGIFGFSEEGGGFEFPSPESGEIVIIPVTEGTGGGEEGGGEEVAFAGIMYPSGDSYPEYCFYNCGNFLSLPWDLPDELTSDGSMDGVIIGAGALWSGSPVPFAAAGTYSNPSNRPLWYAWTEGITTDGGAFLGLTAGITQSDSLEGRLTGIYIRPDGTTGYIKSSDILGAFDGASLWYAAGTLTAYQMGSTYIPPSELYLDSPYIE